MKEWEYYLLTPRQYKCHKQIMKLLSTFFRDKDISRAWMDLENPLLGGLKPIELLVMGRGDKLIKIVKQTLRENHK